MASGKIKWFAPIEKQVYTQPSTYVNQIGQTIQFSTNPFGRYIILSFQVYWRSFSSSTRGSFLTGTTTGAQYYPLAIGGNLGYIRLELLSTNNVGTCALLSSTFDSLCFGHIWASR